MSLAIGLGRKGVLTGQTVQLLLNPDPFMLHAPMTHRHQGVTYMYI